MVEYTTIKVYTNEKAKYEGKELAPSIVSYVRSLKIAARCVVMRGIEGCYENGETTTLRLVDLSYDLPLVIEIILPASESVTVIEKIEAMVTDGIVSVSPAIVTSFHTPSSIFPRHLLVRDIMTSKPIAAHREFTARVAVEMLLDSKLKALPVVDDKGLVLGILSQSDLIKRAGMPARVGLLRLLPHGEFESWLQQAERYKVSDVMTSKPRTIREDHSARDTIHVMVREKLKRLPVIDVHGVLCGMVSRIDVLEALTSRGKNDVAEPAELPDDRMPRLVRDVHLRDQLAIQTDATLKAAIDFLLEKGSQRAAVVDAEGKLVGLVTDEMLLSALDKLDSGFSLLRRIYSTTTASAKVSGFMERKIVSVTEDTPIEEAIRLMTERGFKRIPVIDDEGHFAGMIRRDSVLIALSRLI